MMWCSVFLLFLLCIGCGSKLERDDTVYWTSTAARYASESPFSMRLDRCVREIEGGSGKAWENFIKYGEGLDGEHSQIYSVACSELMRRDPTVCLRKFLQGDSRALKVGKKGFGWSGSRGREILEEVYSRRLYICSDKKERNLVGRFIDETTRIN